MNGDPGAIIVLPDETLGLAWAGYTLYFANISGITIKNRKLVYFLSDRVKHSG
jgi:hypothetical protein